MRHHLSSISPARGNENHAVNERSSVPPGNTSQAVTLQNAAASTGMSPMRTQCSPRPLPSRKNSSVYVDRAHKDGCRWGSEQRVQLCHRSSCSLINQVKPISGLWHTREVHQVWKRPCKIDFIWYLGARSCLGCLSIKATACSPLFDRTNCCGSSSMYSWFLRMSLISISLLRSSWLANCLCRIICINRVILC